MKGIIYKNDKINIEQYKQKLEDNVINKQINQYDSIYQPSYLHINTHEWIRKNTSNNRKVILKRSLKCFPRDIDFDFTCNLIEIDNKLYQIFNDTDISMWYFRIFPISDYINAKEIDANNYYIWQNINMNSSQNIYKLHPLTFECELMH